MSNNRILVARGARLEGALVEEGLLTLAFDTSTERRSVALLRGRRVLWRGVGGLREGGSAGLLTDVERALAAASVTLKDVGLFAVAAGPGSFTGLRSGLATVKGLALVTGKPAVGVPTLHAVAYAARPGRRILASIPAGRGEVFAQMLGVTAEGRVTEHGRPEHLPPARLVEKIARLGVGVKWAGGGALKFEGLIREGAARAGVEFADDAGGTNAPGEGAWLLSRADEALAECVAAIALSGGGSGGVSSGAWGLSAIYVRPSDAELKE